MPLTPTRQAFLRERAALAASIALAALAAQIVALSLPSVAAALIHPTQAIDGPANDILEVDGAAMASDGSGGVLYRALIEGVPHLYAVPFDEGRFGAPTQVDIEDPYGASQPAIAAGEKGRLLVVWVQARAVKRDGATVYELQSASLAPGASSFGRPITIDADVGEPNTGNASHVEPRLAMAPDGEAYVVYRVLTDECATDGGADDTSPINPRNSECPAAGGGELMEVRVARFDYLLWSSLGAINRNTQIAMPAPKAANAPTIGIGVEGDGVVAWQEPENAGEPPRIWVRRLFGTRQGAVLPASPEKLGGVPVNSIAEDPEVAVSRFGEAKIAFQIDGANGSAVPSDELFVNGLPSGFDPKGATLEGALPLPGATASGSGPPTAAIGPSGEYRLAWTQDGTVRQLSGSLQGAGSPVSVGAGSGAVGTTVNPSGGGTTAWTATVEGSPVIEAEEEYTGGAYQAARLAGVTAGPISGFSFAGSGEGAALIAWMQGPPGDSEVVGDFVQAPPSTLVVSAPEEWVRSRDAAITWESVSDAVANVTYTVYVDGQPFASGITGTRASLSAAALGNGVHELQVLATDSAGQRTMSAKVPVKIDASPPVVKVKLARHRTAVRVEVTDDASGVDAQATRISFGDGKHANGHVKTTHVYEHAGRYTITAHVRDKVGRHATVRIPVRVR